MLLHVQTADATPPATATVPPDSDDPFEPDASDQDSTPDEYEEVPTAVACSDTDDEEDWMTDDGVEEEIDHDIHTITWNQSKV